MRFSAPRSLSPSPERRQRRPFISSYSNASQRGARSPQALKRSSSTFGVHFDSDSEEYSDEIVSVSDGDALDGSIIKIESDESDNDLTDALQYVTISPTRYASNSPCILPLSLRRPFTSNSLRPRPNPSEERRMEETVAAIRLHTRHHDPYEDWEKQTRKDAFVREIQSCYHVLRF